MFGSKKFNASMALALAACVTVSPVCSAGLLDQLKDVKIPGVTSQSQSSDKDQACSAGLMATIGGLACAALSHKKGSKKLEIALACGVVTYIGCELANHYKAQQVKTQESVVADYKQQSGQANLPEKATLTNFHTTVAPNATVARGNAISFVSDIVVVPGRTQPNTEIVHEVAIVDSAGDQWGQPVKKIPNQGSNNAGAYKSEFTLNLRKEMEEGQYNLRQSVYVNGEMQRSESVPFQVLANGEIRTDRQLALLQ